MPHLLHIDSSVSPSSVSKELAIRFREVWEAENPQAIVTYRDIGLNPIPHLTQQAVTAGFTPVEFHSEEQKAATLVRDELIDELLAADHLLLSSPMYNWSVPSSLKAWIDQVLVNDKTMTYDGSPGPLAGRPVTVVASYGGGYSPGTPREKANFCGPYLETVFGLGLGMQVEIIAAELSLAPRVAAMASLVPLAEQSKAQALLAVEQRARSLSERISGTTVDA
jgi:FMN-dependent NADH-azoreductase